MSFVKKNICVLQTIYPKSCFAYMSFYFLDIMYEMRKM